MPNPPKKPREPLSRVRRKEKIVFASRLQRNNEIVKKIKEKMNHPRGAQLPSFLLFQKYLNQQLCREFGIVGKRKRKIETIILSIEAQRGHALTEKQKGLQSQLKLGLMRELREDYPKFMARLDEIIIESKNPKRARQTRQILEFVNVESPEARRKRLLRAKETEMFRRIFNECARHFGLFGKSRHTAFRLFEKEGHLLMQMGIDQAYGKIANAKKHRDAYEKIKASVNEFLGNDAAAFRELYAKIQREMDLAEH